MGYGGKVVEQARARELRVGGMTVPDIAAVLGVSRSSVSLWVRDVPVPPRARRRTRSQTPHPHKLRREAETQAMDELGRERLGHLDDQAFLAAGAALYAGEGTKRPGAVAFTNTNPDLLAMFLRWLRTHFDIDEARLRVALYLHADLDLDDAVTFWSRRLEIPVEQFTKPYRADAPANVRRNRHPMGCASVKYSCARTHREVMGLVRALLSSDVPFRGSSAGRATDC